MNQDMIGRAFSTRMSALARETSGKGLIRFTLAGCVIATAFASTSPAFRANPFLGGAVSDLRHKLPETLEKARRAMGG